MGGGRWVEVVKVVEGEGGKGVRVRAWEGKKRIGIVLKDYCVKKYLLHSVNLAPYLLYITV